VADRYRPDCALSVQSRSIVEPQYPCPKSSCPATLILFAGWMRGDLSRAGVEFFGWLRNVDELSRAITDTAASIMSQNDLHRSWQDYTAS
jgi:hypothetical protein